MDPFGFGAIVQTVSAQGADCRGLAGVGQIRPLRVVVAHGPGEAQDAADLQVALWSSLRRSGTAGGHCGRRGGADCWSEHNAAVHHLLVVLAGPAPDPWLDGIVREWRRQGRTTVGLVSLTVDPAAVLPASMRREVALRYDAAPWEAVDDILDLALLADRQRRAFISYAHSDGADAAEAVFGALSRYRFDTYLDRFRTAPAENYLERIRDELAEGALVVVVESLDAMASRWVEAEILVARASRLGVLAVNLDPAIRHPWIPDRDRHAVPPGAIGDPSVLGDLVHEVERRHRRARLRRARGRRRDLWEALSHAGVSPWTIERHPEGDGLRVGGAHDILLVDRLPDLGAARQASLRAEGVRTPVVVGPRPARPAVAADLAWLSGATPVRVRPDDAMAPLAADLQGGSV